MNRCLYCELAWEERDRALEMMQHVNALHPEQTFLCPRRTEHQVLRPFVELRDCWIREVNGDRTCSYCGSMSEDDLVDIMTRFLAGEAGYSFSHSYKTYKVYAHRPGVGNASQGGIKFYKPHIDKGHPEFAKRCALFNEACARSREAMAAMLERPRGIRLS
jgi:hypothetical protein